MPNYTGSDCPICGKLFTETDDIVVCPVCGAPHHRECYKTVGHCGNEEQHESGYRWLPPPPPEGQAPQDRVVCRSCGADNPAGNFFCEACGQRVTGEPQQGQQQSQQPYNQPRGQQPQGGIFGDFLNAANLDYTQVLDKGVTLKEACDFVGPSAIPFIFKFKRLVYGGISFNWSAFLLGPYYFFYRRMYKAGAVLFAVMLAASLPSLYYILLSLSSGGSVSMLTVTVAADAVPQWLTIANWLAQLLSAAASVFCGFFFDKLYYKQMLGKVTALRESGRVSPGTQEYTYAVASSGGISRGAVLTAVSVTFAISMVFALVGTYYFR